MAKMVCLDLLQGILQGTLTIPMITEEGHMMMMMMMVLGSKTQDSEDNLLEIAVALMKMVSSIEITLESEDLEMILVLKMI